LGEKRFGSRLVLAAAIAIAIPLGGCSTYAVSRYAVSVENVTAMRKIGGHPINVGEFRAKGDEASSIGCRAVGPIKTPDGEPFSQYVRKAFISELTLAEVYSPSAPVTITGTVDRVDFSSTSGAWEIGLTVTSSNGKSIHTDEEYSFSSSFFGETACNQTAQAFMPGIQDLIGKIVHDPEFRGLVGADPVPTPKVTNADVKASGGQRRH
jgi:hypothetical protein